MRLMLRYVVPIALSVVAAVFVSVSKTGAGPSSQGSPTEGKQDETPVGPKWWPSKWGEGDQRGAANLISPEKVAEAGRLIRDGKIFQLGRVYEYGMPLPGKRHFSLTIPGVPTAEPEGENMMVSHDEMFSGEIGQIGTQMDGLGHVGVRLPDDDYFYNGFKLSEFGDAYGLKKLGVENIGAFFTRGVLIDVARYKGVERLQNGYAITPADLEGALKAQGGKITKGDVVLVRTGHGRLWMKDNETYGAGEPGLGLAAAKWLTDRDICLVGSDNWAIEVVPHENPKRPFEVHQWTITRNGVYHLENLDLEQLAADRVYEFAFVFVPVPIRGATGSPGNPIAVR
jgi:kynurenine formamidase